MAGPRTRGLVGTEASPSGVTGIVVRSRRVSIGRVRIVMRHTPQSARTSILVKKYPAGKRMHRCRALRVTPSYTTACVPLSHGASLPSKCIVAASIFIEVHLIARQQHSFWGTDAGSEEEERSAGK